MRTRNKIPLELEELKAKFDNWRKVRTKRHLSEDLWDEAINLASKIGVAQVSKALKLDFVRLKIRTQNRSIQEHAPAARNEEDARIRGGLNSGVQVVRVPAGAKSTFIELAPLSGRAGSAKGSAAKVQVHFGPERRVEIGFENPEAKDWENLFSGLLRAQGHPPIGGAS